MNAIGRYLLRCSLIMAALIVAGCGPVRESVSEPETVTATSHFSRQDIEDIVEIVTDELYPATGRQLLAQPVIEFVTPEALKAIMIRGGISDPELDQRISAYAAIYRQESNTVYVMSDNIRLAAGSAKKVEDEVYYTLLVTIAHELAHALQHQHHDLDRIFREARTAEHYRTIRTIVEGHAELQTALVLKQIGLIPDVATYLRSADTGSEPATTESDPISRRIHTLYIDGRRFFDYHYQRGGNQKAWAILADPPLSADIIRSPERLPGISETGSLPESKGFRKDNGDCGAEYQILCGMDLRREQKEAKKGKTL